MILSDSLGFQVNAVARGMSGQLSAALQPLGLTPAQWSVLQYVEEHPGMHQEQLAIDLGTDAATVTGILSRLEAKGAIRRVRDPDDGRRRLVHVTEDADSGAGVPLARAVNDLALTGFTAMERSLLADYLRRIQTNLDIADRDA